MAADFDGERIWKRAMACKLAREAMGVYLSLNNIVESQIPFPKTLGIHNDVFASKFYDESVICTYTVQNAVNLNGAPMVWRNNFIPVAILGDKIILHNDIIPVVRLQQHRLQETFEKINSKGSRILNAGIPPRKHSRHALTGIISRSILESNLWYDSMYENDSQIRCSDEESAEWLPIDQRYFQLKPDTPNYVDLIFSLMIQPLIHGKLRLASQILQILRNLKEKVLSFQMRIHGKTLQFLVLRAQWILICPAQIWNFKHLLLRTI